MEQKGYIDSYVYQYSTYVTMALQQNGSKLAKAVMHQALKGKAAEVAEIIQETDAIPDLIFERDTPNVNIEHQRRWVMPRNWKWATLVDRIHSLETIVDPTKQYVQAGAAAMGRTQDDAILAGLFGPNFVGANIAQNNVTPNLMAYNNGSQVIAADVGASSATGMNVDKILAAQEKLLSSDVDMSKEACWMLLTARQGTELKQDIRFTSRDFVGSTVLDQNGLPASFAGFNFIITERIPGGSKFNSRDITGVTGYETGETYLLPFFTTRGMLLGTWEDLYAQISQRSDKNYAWQAYLEGTWGATRLEEKRCGIIVCSN